MNRGYVVVMLGLFVVCCGTWSDTERRQKRVINGQLLRDRKSGYASPLYYVWIGFSRGFFETNEWQWARQSCGGALLTTSIVQSACHCFVSWHSPRKNGNEWHYRNSNSFEAVVGCNEWASYRETPCRPIEISKYMIHPLCRKVWGWISHDNALFTLKKPVTVSKLVKPAPSYTIDEMTRMWTRFVSDRAVCMVMGFGRYYSRDSTTQSNVLRHGWQSIRSYLECYEDYTFQSTRLERTNLSNYQEFATWTCLKPFGKEVGTSNEVMVAKGDSGSPITCDNIYFALVSQAGPTFVAEHTNTNDLVFYAYANSRYYRQIMINDMADKWKTDCHRDHPIPPGSLMFPGEAPRNFHAVNRAGNGHISRSTNEAYYLYMCALFLMIAECH